MRVEQFFVFFLTVFHFETMERKMRLEDEIRFELKAVLIIQMILDVYS